MEDMNESGATAPQTPNEPMHADAMERDHENIGADLNDDHGLRDFSDGEPVGEPYDSAESGVAEIEFDGKKFSVPSELKDGFLMGADYTRKSQENASTRRQLSARGQHLDQLVQTTQQELQLRAQLMGIEAQFDALAHEKAAAGNDPAALQSVSAKERQLQHTAAQLGQQLQMATGQRSEQARLLQTQRLRETADYAQKTIPGWTPEVDAKITDFAEQVLGADRDQLSQLYNPQFYHGLYLAWIGQQTLEKQGAAPKSGWSKGERKPLKTVNSKGNPMGRKSIHDMSMDEYAAHRNRQEAADTRR